MAIAPICKVLFLFSLLVGVFAQEAAEKAVKPKESETSDAGALRALEAKLLQEQAANAVYSFATSIVDGIMDNMQFRTETRKGLDLVGSYSYSDGFFNRTITYVADQNGYRVTSETVEPLGKGPRVNPNGRAHIHTTVDGQEFEYDISGADIQKTNMVPAKETPKA